MKEENASRVLRVSVCIALCLSLMFSLMTLSEVSGAEDKYSAVYFGLSLLGMTAYELILFYYKRKSAPAKSNWLHLGYAAICFASAICAFIFHNLSRLFVLSPVIMLVVPIIKRILAIVRKSKARTRLYNVLVLIVCVLSLLFTFILWKYSQDRYSFTAVLACCIIIMTCLINICAMVFSQFNKLVLMRIVNKTYAGEILVGLLLLVVAFSLVLMHNEESIHSFGDALWYCFAIITTIGFGDITAVSMVGRILSVILGLYGIIVVSILTSIIVNFYSEVKDVKNGDADQSASPDDAAQRTADNPILEMDELPVKATDTVDAADAGATADTVPTDPAE